MPERADTHLLHHRETDAKGSDYRGKRYAEEREVIVQRAMDSHTKWIVGVVGAGIISLLTILALRDRQSIDQTQIHQEGRIRIQEQTTARHEADLQVLKSQGSRQISDTQEMKENLKQMNDKLDRVLTEVRRANR